MHEITIAPSGTAIVVDARSRDLAMFSASVTTVADTENLIVLRKAIEIDFLSNFSSRAGQQYCFPCPVILWGSGYRARSSEGQVEVMSAGEEAAASVLIVGGCGFPGGLRSFPRPQPGIVVNNPCLISVPTHRNLNRATADAAWTGAMMRLSMGKRFLVRVVEGQSNYLRVWEFCADTPTPVFPREHSGLLFRQGS